MTNAIQVKENELIDRGFISPSAHANCSVCKELLSLPAKFCGECGTAVTLPAKVSPQITIDHSSDHHLSSEYLNEQRAKAKGVPAFAHVSPQIKKTIPPELKKEYGKIVCHLARERFFLLAHYVIFLGFNLAGLWLALKAYNEFFADEITRVVVALIPLCLINSVAFGSLVPIKGTKREIARLKERMVYLHYQIEYLNLA